MHPPHEAFGTDAGKPSYSQPQDNQFPDSLPMMTHSYRFAEKEAGREWFSSEGRRRQYAVSSDI